MKTWGDLGRLLLNGLSPLSPSSMSTFVVLPQAQWSSMALPYPNSIWQKDSQFADGIIYRLQTNSSATKVKQEIIVSFAEKQLLYLQISPFPNFLPCQIVCHLTFGWSNCRSILENFFLLYSLFALTCCIMANHLIWLMLDYYDH